MSQKIHSILFVDDEPLAIRGYQRSTEEYSDYWKVDFAASGEEALEKMSAQVFDAIITDMQMPGMDGIQLLEAVSETEPGTLRFVLSGNTNEAQVLKSSHLVHQMIPKPSEMEKIFDIVERACCLRDTLSSPELLRLITGIKTLPSVPRLYNQLIEHLQSETDSSESVGNIIAQDAAMTAKILQLVNSAFFGISENISSPHKAVTFLGISTIKSLVLGIHVFSEFQNKGTYPISIDKVWQHSLRVSGLAYLIARDLKFPNRDRENARVSGVLHDIGLLMSFQIPGFFRHVKLNHDHQTIIETEYKFLKTSHAEMGGCLLGIWGLPSQIVEAVTFHHRPSAQQTVIQSTPDLLAVLHLADGLVNLLADVKEHDYAYYFDLPYLEKLGLVNHLDEWVEMSKLFLNDPT